MRFKIRTKIPHVHFAYYDVRASPWRPYCNARAWPQQCWKSFKLRFSDHGTKKMLGVVGSKVWPVSNFAQQHATPNNVGSCCTAMLRPFARTLTVKRKKKGSQLFYFKWPHTETKSSIILHSEVLKQRHSNTTMFVINLLIWTVLVYYCSKAEERNGKIERTLSVDWGEFVGRGVNSKIAKATAAKRAVQALKRISNVTNPVDGQLSGH